MWYWSSLKASLSYWSVHEKMTVVILKALVPWWPKNLEIPKYAWSQFIHSNVVLRTVYFGFTKMSIVLWKRAVSQRYSYTYAIDSHPYTVGQIQLAAGSASNTSSYQTSVIGWKPLFCLLILPASDIRSTLLSRQSLTHALPKWTLSAYCVAKSVFAESSTMNQEEKANTNYKWHILVMKTFIDINKLCTLIQMLIHSDLTNKDKCRESLSDVSNHVSMQSLRNWIEIYSYLSGILNYVHSLSFFPCLHSKNLEGKKCTHMVKASFIWAFGKNYLYYFVFQLFSISLAKI